MFVFDHILLPHVVISDFQLLSVIFFIKLNVVRSPTAKMKNLCIPANQLDFNVWSVIHHFVTLLSVQKLFIARCEKRAF